MKQKGLHCGLRCRPVGLMLLCVAECGLLVVFTVSLVRLTAAAVETVGADLTLGEADALHQFLDF